ncbi:hypothetical protein KC19_5G168800 [Ceratodon purpureus]|uniref:Tr-type G domain-containing protein n=1 Tax=Ceratodon purpureus TaxID=3225 RepID=A0A8T0I3X9_CERPU|nr:hypothetical protein KC19_5G168800 [Ceratodon purpureus]
MSDLQDSSADHDWEHEDKIIEPPKFAFSALSAASAEFVPKQYLKVALETKTEVPKAEQADTEHIATKLEENLNLKDEEKQAEATEEEAEKAAPPAASTPEPATTVEEPHAPDAVPEEEHHEEPKEEDAGDSRQHLNVVFIGHVDAGKSTIGGQILYLSDMVDERTIQKYEREAKDKNRDSWYMAYIMDTNEEERAKGKTVEVGRAHFETEKTRFTILDAPGHKNYVPNMISGASQADVGVLVISARKGEFETGFERGGQTREHAQLAKTLGVSKLLVVVNKMDDPSVEWSKERFDEIEKKIVPFLKSCGYNTKKDVQFLPISGLFGSNMKERMTKSTCPWWDGPCLFEALDAVELPLRDPKGSFRMPLIDKFRDMGTVVMGKIESGSVRRGDTLMVMPNKAQVKVVTVYRDNDEVNYAKPGENLRIRISGVEEEDIIPGFVLSSVNRPIPAVLEFDAQLQILELLDHKAIFTAGYKAILHIHSVVEECEIMGLIHQIDPKTKKPIRKKVLFVKSGAVVVVRIQVSQLICVEKFEDFPQLGRFTLRDEGKTVAIGKVVKFPKLEGSSQN